MNKDLNLSSRDLIDLDHSHPGGIHYPSGRAPEGINNDEGGDVPYAKWVEGKFSNSNVHFNIYTPLDGQFTPYDGDTKLPDLPPVTVTAKRKKKH